MKGGRVVSDFQIFTQVLIRRDEGEGEAVPDGVAACPGTAIPRKLDIAKIMHWETQPGEEMARRWICYTLIRCLAREGGAVLWFRCSTRTEFC